MDEWHGDTGDLSFMHQLQLDYYLMSRIALPNWRKQKQRTSSQSGHGMCQVRDEAGPPLILAGQDGLTCTIFCMAGKTLWQKHAADCRDTLLADRQHSLTFRGDLRQHWMHLPMHSQC